MDKYGYIGIETLLNFCKNSKDHAVTPNDFMRMKRVKEPERKTGYWILADAYGGRKRWRCSECYAFALKTDDGQENLSDYCPCCGAYMKGENNENQNS